MKEEGSPMGPLLRGVNAIADAIKDEFPHVAVDTLAYVDENRRREGKRASCVLCVSCVLCAVCYAPRAVKRVAYI
jgi:hypothetical protein